MAEPAVPDPTPQATRQTGAPAESFRLAVDELMGGAAVEAVAPGEATKGEPAGAPAADKPVVQAEPEAEQESGVLRELKAYTQAQDRWSRERERLTSEAKGATDRAKREVLAALESDDPDGQLERLGMAADVRRRLVQRLVLRHVPKDKADPALAQRIEIEEARAEARAANARLDRYIQEQKEERERERHATEQRKAAESVLGTLEDAFRNAGDDVKHAKSRYGKRRDVALRDAIELGKELAAKGRIGPRMTEPEIAKMLVRELNARYREDFGLADDAPGAQVAADPPPKVKNTNAAEVSAARTISRGATEVTRPPPAQSSPLDEDSWLDEEAALFARHRREGKFSALP